MIQYILECIAFQLLFLIIYDFFLKRETFFQLNRAYLIGSYVLSMVLPWVKIEALRTTVPERFIVYPEYLWNDTNDIIVKTTESSWYSMSWQETLLFGGMLVAAGFFGYKMWQLYQLRKTGEIDYFNDFTRIVIANSNVAFSFFKSIFLGDKVLKGEHENIIQHELVHIKQKHTWDLLFFELMRIAGWFNPLVYVYQSRVSELHEFIADSQIVKGNKKEHYELLLSQVFQTQNISFINQFFKSSLIKKRIVMLKKSKSKEVWKLKYLALVPILAGMLFYTSCENESNQNSESENNDTVIAVGDVENLTEHEENLVYSRLKTLSDKVDTWELEVHDSETIVRFSPAQNENYITGLHNEPIRAQMSVELKDQNKFYKNFSRSFGKGKDWKAALRKSNIVPFSLIEEVPVFPGCENEADKRACFQSMMQRHISKNFRYPQEAQQKGIQGRVNLMFTIDEQGNIVNIRRRGPDKLLEDEAVRIISLLPKMTPGKYERKPAKVPFSIPIYFKLEQVGFNPQLHDTNYVNLQNEQLSEMTNDVQIEYRNAIPFGMVEQVPVFPGCEDAADLTACFQQKIYRHIAKNFRYPEEAQEKGVQGRVSVIFLMDENGNITNISKRGPDKLLEEEAERIISRLPQMRPGSHQGKNVSVPYSVPITFKLQ